MSNTEIISLDSSKTSFLSYSIAQLKKSSVKGSRFLWTRPRDRDRGRRGAETSRGPRSESTTTVARL